MHLLNNIKYMLALRNNWKYTIWCVACDRRSCSCNKNRMAYSGIDTSTTATRVNSKLKRLLTKQLIKFVLLRSGIDWNPSMRYDNKIKMFLFSFGAFGCVARALRSSVFWVRLVSVVPHQTHTAILYLHFLHVWFSRYCWTISHFSMRCVRWLSLRGCIEDGVGWKFTMWNAKYVWMGRWQSAIFNSRSLKWLFGRSLLR